MDFNYLRKGKTILEQSGRKLADVFTHVPVASQVPVVINKTAEKVTDAIKDIPDSVHNLKVLNKNALNALKTKSRTAVKRTELTDTQTKELPAVRNTELTDIQYTPDTGENSIPPEIREKLKNRKVAEERKALRRTKFKKKLAKGSAGTIVGLSIMLAGLFDSPTEMIRQQTINNLNNNEAIEIMIDEEDIGSEEDERKKTEIAPSGKGLPKKIADAIRNFIKGLPQWVKMCVCVPLWGAGYGITYLLSLLYTTVLSPILSHVIGFVLLAAALLTAFAVTMKCIFPNMPLRKILCRRNITIVLAGALVLKVLDIVVPLLWPDYIRYKHLIMIIAGIAFLLVIINAIRRWRKKKRSKKKSLPELPD